MSGKNYNNNNNNTLNNNNNDGSMGKNNDPYCTPCMHSCGNNNNNNSNNNNNNGGAGTGSGPASAGSAAYGVPPIQVTAKVLFGSVSHLRPQCGTEEKIIKNPHRVSHYHRPYYHTASHLKTPLAVYNSIHNQNIKLYSHRKITNDSSYFPYLCYKTFLDHHLHGDQTPPYHIITLRPPQNTSPQPVNTFTSYIFEIFS